MKRRPLGSSLRDPGRCLNFLDSCAFDPDSAPEYKASRVIYQLYQNNQISLQVNHSTKKEIEHPNTPARVKREARDFNYTIPTNLIPVEQKQKTEIWEILTGNGKPENYKEDAEHVFTAGKHVGYFITADKRILKKKIEIEKISPVKIVKPTEFIKILDMYENT